MYVLRLIAEFLVVFPTSEFRSRAQWHYLLRASWPINPKLIASCPFKVAIRLLPHLDNAPTCTLYTATITLQLVSCAGREKEVSEGISHERFPQLIVKKNSSPVTQNVNYIIFISFRHSTHHHFINPLSNKLIQLPIDLVWHKDIDHKL